VTPLLPRSKVVESKSRFLQIADDYAWLNPHLTLEVIWDEDRRGIEATEPTWRKWRPSDPTSAHWYDPARFERLVAAYVADDQDRGRARAVREFISEFRGLSGSAKQKTVLDTAGMARMALGDDLFTDGAGDSSALTRLLKAMQTATKPVKPQDLGLIGKEHLAAKFAAAGADPASFKYTRTLRDDDGIPAVVEVGFGYCPNSTAGRRMITGVNWSVGINNPFKNLGPHGDSLDGVLTNLRANRDAPIVVVVHLACPRIIYTDRGKGSLVLAGDLTEQGTDGADE
jgi:hypothetical protein